MALSAWAFFSFCLCATHSHTQTHASTQLHGLFVMVTVRAEQRDIDRQRERERERKRGGCRDTKKVLGLEGVDSVPLFFLWSWHFQLFPELMCAWLVCFVNCRVTAKLPVWPRRKGTRTVAKVLCATALGPTVQGNGQMEIICHTVYVYHIPV